MSIYSSNKSLVLSYLRKLSVLALIMCFIATNVEAIVVYDIEPPNALPAAGYSLNVDTFSLSPELGTVKFVHKGTSDKVVFHIQDAHCNYAAQNKIYDIINVLNQEYQVKELNLEGGYGDYDLSVFTEMPDKAIRKKVADYFVKWGDVSGPELFALMNPEKVKLWGVENIELYLKNLGVYRDSLSYGDKAKALMKNLSHYLNNLKMHMFNDALLTMDTKYAAYRSNNIEFKDYLEYLTQQAKNQGIELKQYPNLFLLSHVLDEEKLVDFKKANLQREELINDLEKRISKNDMHKLAITLAQLKNKVLSEYDFYEYLLQTARKYGKNVKDYPKLHQYIIYISMYNKVDKSLIMDEMDKIERVLKEGFYENESQEELDSLSRNLILMQALFDFSFTVRDYDYYLNNVDDFSVAKYLIFIKKYASRYKIDPVFDTEIQDLDHYREKITGFYEFSFKRDIAFLDNMKLSGKEVKSGIIVTGGFHTENLLARLKEEDVSYVSIMPNFISKKGYKSPYFEILADKKVPEFDQQIETIFFSIQVPSIMNIINLLANNDPQREEIFRIKALALASMASDLGKSKVIITSDNKYIVFDMKKGEPSVTEYAEDAFTAEYNKESDYMIVERDVVLTKTSAIWALSRVAEENIKTLKPSTNIDIAEFKKQAKELLAQLPVLEQTLPKNIIEFIQFKKELIDAKGEPIAVSSNSAIYLSGTSIEDALLLLIHELVGGSFSRNNDYLNGHRLATEVEESIATNDIEAANTLLSTAQKYADGKVLWEMSDEEAADAKGMDFAMAFSFGNIGNTAKKIANYLNSDDVRGTLESIYGDNRSRLQEVNGVLHDLVDKMVPIIGEVEAKIVILNVFKKSSKADPSIEWLNSIGKFTDSVHGWLSSDPESYSRIFNMIVEVSENSRSLEGFGLILDMLFSNNYSIEDITFLFMDDNPSELSVYIKKPWNRLSEIADKNSKKYMRLRSIFNTYPATYNSEILNGIAASEDIRELFLDNIKTNQLEYIYSIINVYNQNRSLIVSRITQSRALDDRLSSKKNKQEQIKEFLTAFVYKSNGNDMLGVVSGKDFIADPYITRTTKQVQSLDAQLFQSFKDPVITKPVKEIAENDVNEYAVNNSSLFGIRIEDKTKRKAYPIEVNGKKVAVKFLKENECRDIFGESYTVAQEQYSDNTLNVDSYLLRSYNGSYTIVVVDRGDQTEVNEALKTSVDKLLTISRMIESLKVLESETAVTDLLGIDSMSESTLEQKLEGVKNFAQFSSRYNNRSKHLNRDKKKGINVSERDKQLFDYLMVYSIMSELLQHGYQLAHLSDEDIKTMKLTTLFKEIMNKTPTLFSGNNGIPLPENWEYFKGDYDKDFKSGVPYLEPSSTIKRKSASAIGNIRRVDGETVTNFDDLDINIDFAAGEISISAKEGELLRGDISLQVEPLPMNTGQKDEFISSLKDLLKDSRTKNTLTSEETKQVNGLIEELTGSEIFIFRGGEEDNFFGFSNNGRLFLDEKMLLEPISLLHEMGESKVEVPSGYGELNRHTFLRGAGSKTREAVSSIVLESDKRLLSEMESSVEFFLKKLSEQRNKMNLGPTPLPEEGIIRYNFATKEDRSIGTEKEMDFSKQERINSLGLKKYLFGIQDHLDPFLNAEFTNSIKVLTNSLNRGVHDIIVIRESDVFASSKLAQLKRLAKDGMMKAGHNLTLMVQRPGEDLEYVLERAYKQADSINKKSPNKLPKIFLDLAYGVEDSELLKEVSAGIRSYVIKQERENMTVIVDELIENLPSGEAPKIDVGKLIVVASGLLDDKRRVVNFNMSAEDLTESRKTMITAFQKSEIIQLTDKYNTNTAAGLNEIINAITSGVLLMRITRINWEEITDWFEANTEIMRSL